MVLGVLTGIDSVAAAVPSREGEPYSQLLPILLLCLLAAERELVLS